jgi:hypothetical protein
MVANPERGELTFRVADLSVEFSVAVASAELRVPAASRPDLTETAWKLAWDILFIELIEP